MGDTGRSLNPISKIIVFWEDKYIKHFFKFSTSLENTICNPN